MESSYASNIEECKGNSILIEAKTFRQARERTYLRCPLESYPCRMKMKEAGLFIVCDKDRRVIAVCVYCRKAFTGWNGRHDPYKVHEVLSRECVFILNARNIQIPTSPIIESLPRREEVRPSLHNMAELPKRIKSFEQWPYVLPHPSAETLADAGFFYIQQSTRIECFFCHGQISIFHLNANFMSAHTDQCKYFQHLGNHPQRTPLDIRASDKRYELLNIPKNNVNFYILCCTSASTPSILLSALVPLPNAYESQTSDQVLKQLLRNAGFTQGINWATSSDGALVNILEELARNPEDLRTQPADIKSLIEESSTSSTATAYDFAFRCKTCLTTDASPHAVSIKCCHLGLCYNECFSKWMTCVVCGYTLGKAVRVRQV